MRYAALFPLVIMASASSFAQAADPPRLQLKDGDRIVYLGNTFAEQDGSYGYLETLLTIRNPDINFTFRNLGWSGDTVWGEARARFGTKADGFQHLKEHVLALKPTVLLVAYGMNESFAGKAGLAEFESGLNILLDTLDQTKAKIVLISPLPHEKLPPPLPDPAKHNADIALYRDAMAKVAQSRGAGFIDGTMLPAQTATTARLTEDGIHPTPDGYSFLATALAHQLGVPIDTGRSLSLDSDGKVSEAQGWKVENLRATDHGYSFSAQADHLPVSGFWSFVLTGASHAKGGSFGLKVDGAPVKMGLLTGSVYSVHSGPETDQVEKLRALINKKNELYFHRWRPQNETYLFGFRKHEQGNNAVEIPQFDPLIAELEAEINQLKKPAKHTYELIRDEAGK